MVKKITAEMAVTNLFQNFVAYVVAAVLLAGSLAVHNPFLVAGDLTLQGIVAQLIPYLVSGLLFVASITTAIAAALQKLEPHAALTVLFSNPQLAALAATLLAVGQLFIAQANGFATTQPVASAVLYVIGGVLWLGSIAVSGLIATPTVPLKLKK